MFFLFFYLSLYLSTYLILKLNFCTASLVLHPFSNLHWFTSSITFDTYCIVLKRSKQPDSKNTWYMSRNDLLLLKFFKDQYSMRWFVIVWLYWATEDCVCFRHTLVIVVAFYTRCNFAKLFILSSHISNSKLFKVEAW